LAIHHKAPAKAPAWRLCWRFKISIHFSLARAPEQFLSFSFSGAIAGARQALYVEL